MERITVESIPIVVGREEDGRWWADIESMPGVMAYGATRESAIAAVRALAYKWIRIISGAGRNGRLAMTATSEVAKPALITSGRGLNRAAQSVCGRGGFAQ